MTDRFSIFRRRVSTQADDITEERQSSGSSDEQLAEMAKNGDRDAFLMLYDRYLDKVYNRVRSKIPSADVEDVTQEAFIAVMRSLNNFERRSKFSTWLYTIVSRQIADYYRNRSRKEPEEQVDIDDVAYAIGGPSYEHDNLDEWAMMQKALNVLPIHYQEIIFMRFADGLTFADIADERGQTLEAVKSLYRRAIQALRDEMGGAA